MKNKELPSTVKVLGKSYDKVENLGQGSFGQVGRYQPKNKKSVTTDDVTLKFEFSNDEDEEYSLALQNKTKTTVQRYYPSWQRTKVKLDFWAPNVTVQLAPFLGKQNRAKYKPISLADGLRTTLAVLHDLSRFHNHTPRFGKPTIHQDLKPDNVVFDEKEVAYDECMAVSDKQEKEAYDHYYFYLENDQIYYIKQEANKKNKASQPVLLVKNDIVNEQDLLALKAMITSNKLASEADKKLTEKLFNFINQQAPNQPKLLFLKKRAKVHSDSIIDLDLAKDTENSTHRLVNVEKPVGTPLFVAPEISFSVKTLSADIYALTGMILQFLGCTNPLVEKNKFDINMGQLLDLVQAPFSFTGLLNDNFVGNSFGEYKEQIKICITSLLKLMQSHDWWKRPNINDLLRFFTDIEQIRSYLEQKQNNLDEKNKDEDPEITERLQRCKLISQNVYFAEAKTHHFFIKTSAVATDDAPSIITEEQHKNLPLSVKISFMQRNSNISEQNRHPDKTITKYAELYAEALTLYNNVTNYPSPYSRLKFADFLYKHVSFFAAMQEWAPDLSAPINHFYFTAGGNTQTLQELAKNKSYSSLVIGLGGRIYFFINNDPEKIFVDKISEKRIQILENYLFLSLQENNEKSDHKISNLKLREYASLYTQLLANYYSINIQQENSEKAKNRFCRFCRFYMKNITLIEDIKKLMPEWTSEIDALYTTMMPIEMNNFVTSLSQLKKTLKTDLLKEKETKQALQNLIKIMHSLYEKPSTENKKQLFAWLKGNENIRTNPPEDYKALTVKAENLSVYFFKDAYKKDLKNDSAFFTSEMNKRVHTRDKNNPLTFQEILQHAEKGKRTQKIVMQFYL